MTHIHIQIHQLAYIAAGKDTRKDERETERKLYEDSGKASDRDRRTSKRGKKIKLKTSYFYF